MSIFFKVSSGLVLIGIVLQSIAEEGVVIWTGFQAIGAIGLSLYIGQQFESEYKKSKKGKVK